MAGPSSVARWDGRTVEYELVDCGAVGARPGRLEELCVTDPGHSADIIRGVFNGQMGLPREMVVFNAAAALWVAGSASDWPDGAALAREAIDSGRARDKLEEWVAGSHGRS